MGNTQSVPASSPSSPTSIPNECHAEGSSSWSRTHETLDAVVGKKDHEEKNKEYLPSTPGPTMLSLLSPTLYLPEPALPHFEVASGMVGKDVPMLPPTGKIETLYPTTLSLERIGRDPGLPTPRLELPDPIPSTVFQLPDPAVLPLTPPPFSEHATQTLLVYPDAPPTPPMYVVGSWTQWQSKHFVPAQGLALSLPPNVYTYLFVHNNAWHTHPHLPQSSRLHVLDVYSQEHRQWHHVPPPALPIHLLHFPPAAMSHVVLNHIYTCKPEQNLMSLGITTRYRSKYITTVFYKCMRTSPKKTKKMVKVTKSR